MLDVLRGCLTQNFMQAMPGRLIAWHRYETSIRIVIANNQPHFTSPKLSCDDWHRACFALRLRIRYLTNRTPLPPPSDCLGSQLLVELQ